MLLPLVSSCSSEDEDYGPDQTEEPEPDPIGNERPLPPPTSITCANGTYLTYNNFGGAFLNNYCTSCHHSQIPAEDRQGAPLEANFDSAYLAQVWRASIILKAIGEAPTMPPSQSVPTQERRELSEWLNCGAPEK
jgi:hypothetical protein